MHALKGCLFQQQGWSEADQQVDLATSATTTRSCVLLIKMATEQRTADATGDRSQRSSSQCIPDQGTANATGDRPDRAVTAATTMTIIAAAAMVDMMVTRIG